MSSLAPPLSTSDRLWAGVGVVIATLFAFFAGVVSAFLVPLHIGAVRVPICLALVVIANVAAVRYAFYVSGWRIATLGPMVGWFTAIVLLGLPKTAGDVVVPNDWVGLGFLFFGGMSLVIAAFAGTLTKPTF